MILRPIQGRQAALQAVARCTKSTPQLSFSLSLPLSSSLSPSLSPSLSLSPPWQRLLHTVPARTAAAHAFASREEPPKGHTVPPLLHDEMLKQQGIPGLFSPEGFDLAWTRYQGLMVKKLNDLTAGTPEASTPAQALLLQTARDPAYASLFNHASMAFNNHFFFRGLQSQSRAKPIPPNLATRLTADFSSIDTLRTEMLAAASSMFGPGFVWLVRRHSRESVGPVFRILCTYLAGSPLAGAHSRAQGLDMNVQNVGSLSGLQDMRGGAGGPRATSRAELQRLTTLQNVGSGYGMGGREQRVAPGGVDVTPVLCVNMWEHVWLYDWDIEGKRKFLEAWWDRIDWDVVNSLAGVDGTRTNSFMTGRMGE